MTLEEKTLAQFLDLARFPEEMVFDENGRVYNAYAAHVHSQVLLISARYQTVRAREDALRILREARLQVLAETHNPPSYAYYKLANAAKHLGE